MNFQILFSGKNKKGHCNYSVLNLTTKQLKDTQINQG